MNSYPLISEMTEGLNKSINSKGILFNYLLEFYTHDRSTNYPAFKPEPFGEVVYMFNNFTKVWYEFKNLEESLWYIINEYTTKKYGNNKNLVNLDEGELHFLYTGICDIYTLLNKAGFINLTEPGETFDNFTPEFKLKYEEEMDQ